MDGFDWGSVATYGLTFAGGVAVGALGQYFADRATDKRRSKETVSASKATFESVRRQMPELIAEMKADLSEPKNALLREFFVAKKGWVINSGQPRFRYFYEEHDALDAKVTILENHGYVIDVTPGNAKMYRMTEEFVALVLSS